MNESIARQGIEKGQLTLHADRGSPMIAKPVVHLLADFGVTKSHSRSHMTIPTPRASSAPSNTDPTFPIASVVSKTLKRTASAS